jgi:hypothetical protein
MPSRAWRRGSVPALVLAAALSFGLLRGHTVAAKDPGAAENSASPEPAVGDPSAPASAGARPVEPAEQPARSKPAATKKSRKDVSKKEASKSGKKTSAKKKGAKEDAADAAGGDDGQQGPDPRVVAQVMAIQDRNSANLMAQKGIAGSATGLDEDGNVVIRVYTTGADDPQIPKVIENVPVQVVLTGPIHKWQKPAPQAAVPAAPKTKMKISKPKTKLPPPPAPVLVPDPSGPPLPLIPSSGSGAGASSSSGSPASSSSPPPLSKPQPPPQPAAPPPAPVRTPPAQDRRVLNTRPVPIGVSSMANVSCAAATLGCRVKDSDGNVYALSCNHVYALENAGQNGVTPASQPSPLDDGCKIDLTNDIGTLYNFVKIKFKGGSNIVDCAIVKSTTAQIGNATPSDGYGAPKSSTVAATLGQKVQKYGRTTGYTTGTVNGVNVTVYVGYETGTAVFTDQIEVQGTGGAPSLGEPGDSGSLVVDIVGHPVGLLFAGGGGMTFCNPIDSVLKALDVTIDGQ